jgi:hypothetical protein
MLEAASKGNAAISKQTPLHRPANFTSQNCALIVRNPRHSKAGTNVAAQTLD